MPTIFLSSNLSTSQSPAPPTAEFPAQEEAVAYTLDDRVLGNPVTYGHPHIYLHCQLNNMHNRETPIKLALEEAIENGTSESKPQSLALPCTIDITNNAFHELYGWMIDAQNVRRSCAEGLW